MEILCIGIQESMKIKILFDYDLEQYDAERVVLLRYYTLAL